MKNQENNDLDAEICSNKVYSNDLESAMRYTMNTDVKGGQYFWSKDREDIKFLLC